MLGMEVEIPFVPASRRQPVQALEDSIVVVGQVRQRKRKKVAKLPQSGSAQSRSSADGTSEKVEQTEDPENEAESFNFAAVPNILDDNPSPEDVKKPKRQKKQKTGLFCSSLR
jgi:exosome complex exonuclease RRP6